MRKPYLHQQEVLKQIHRKERIALFIEMRLGKTLIAIRWAIQNSAKRILILCPKSVMSVWYRELELEGIEREQIASLVGPGEDRFNEASQQTTSQFWAITNYEGIVYTPELLDCNWDCIICDESTFIRNPKAKTTKFLINRTQTVKYKAILSGLPNPESYTDFVMQMIFLNDKFMKCENYWQWQKTYCYLLGFQWMLHEWAEKPLLKEIAENAIILSRKDVAMDCKKVYETRYTFTNKEQKKALGELYKDFQTTIKDELITTKFTLPKLEFMYRISSGMTPNGVLLNDAKYQEMIYLLKTDLKNESVVIWFKYNEEILMARSLLNKEKINCAIFTGKEKEGEDLFKEGKIRVILAQAKCGMMGLNWSVASTMIYFSQWWDGQIRAQSEDRIVLPSKKEPLLYINLVCKGTVDEDVAFLLRNKNLTSTKFLDELKVAILKRINRVPSNNR